MLLPSGRRVEKDTPIYSGSNFSWGEATKNCSRPPRDLIIDRNLIISSDEVENKIIETAIKLDEIRDLLGNRPIIVNSWYRPQHINARVGGSKYSRHQYGDAVDIRSYYFSPRQLAAKLDAQHSKGGLGRYPGFVHLDWRGHRARW